MKKTLFLLTGILFSHFMNAQKIHLYFGKNQTHYAYKTNPGQSQPNLENDNGDYYEIGYEHDINKSFIYMGGLSLNQFNNIGGDELNYYSWKTRYIGLQNVIAYSFYNKNAFKALVTAGVGVSTLLSGAQQINNSFYDLKDQDQFNGVFIQPSLGLELRYNLHDIAELSLKYNFSKAWNLSEVNDGEKLSFNNNQIALGIHIPLKQSRKASVEDKQKENEVLKISENSNVFKSEADKTQPVKSDPVVAENSKIVVVDKTAYMKELINGGYVTTYFEVAKTQPISGSMGGIDFVLTYLRANPNSKVKIYGNADETGNAKYNDKLALERAAVVKGFLKAAGIQENRMSIMSKGEDTSVDSDSQEAKGLARRVTFQVD